MQSYPNIGNGRKTVAVAGTRERLVATNLSCKRVTIMALYNNAGFMVIGGATVVALEATRSGIALPAGASVTLDVQDLYPIYIDAETSNDGVSYIYHY